jgi:hypothetical protein
MHAFIMGIWDWVAANPLFGAGIAVVAAFLFWKRPGLVIKLVIAVCVLVALGYLVSGIIDFTMGSAVVKERVIEKSQ